MPIPLQFVPLYGGQEVFVWSDCTLDLGTDFLIGNKGLCMRCTIPKILIKAWFTVYYTSHWVGRGLGQNEANEPGRPKLEKRTEILAIVKAFKAMF